MGPKTIVSYDDTLNDHDALALGRVLAEAGAELELAYVRHTTQSTRSREELAEHEAAALLERGARWLGDLDVPRRVVVSASTGEGLGWLAQQERAEMIVFGSDYRTAAGHVQTGRSAQRLIEGGPTALAIAPANYRSHREIKVRWIGVLENGTDPAARQTAQELAEHLGARVTTSTHGVDLLVVGSRGLGGFQELFLGSVSQQCAHHSPCPVVIVRHIDEGA
jgi:Universal stress protein UspA and related nucleotide-binding proteins